MSALAQTGISLVGALGPGNGKVGSMGGDRRVWSESVKAHQKSAYHVLRGNVGRKHAKDVYYTSIGIEYQREFS